MGNVRLVPPLAGTVKGFPSASDFDRPNSERMLLIGCRIDDVEVERPFQFFVGGVVDDDFDFRLIPFAQEARQVRTHHQLFDALCFASDRAGFQVTRDGVHPDVPGGDGIGNLEFEGHGSVRAGEQMRLPESGFAEVAAQLDGFG